MRAQKIQFLEIVTGIEQRAAFGGAGLVVEAERGALVLHVDGACAQQVDQPRQHRPNAPRFSREPCAIEMIAACAAFGANAPNGAGVGSLSGVKRRSSVSGACIAGFAAVKQSVARMRAAISGRSPVQYSAIEEPAE